MESPTVFKVYVETHFSTRLHGTYETRAAAYAECDKLTKGPRFLVAYVQEELS